MEYKQTHWRNYCISLNNETPIGSIWKMAKMFKGTKRNYNNNVDCVPWINEFVNRHSPPSAVNEIILTSLDINNNSFIDKRITPNELKNKINQLKNTADSFVKINAKITTIPRNC